MKIDSFISAARFRITGGSEYQWRCFGDHARWLDMGWEGRDDRWQASAVFDSRDQTVYEIMVYDYVDNRAWVWHEPRWRDQYLQECDQRGVDPKTAWDDVPYTVLDSEEEIIYYLREVVSTETGEVELNLPNDALLRLCMLAHEKDITLNQMVELILREAIEREGILLPTAEPQPEASMEPQKRRSKKRKNT